ncbi:MAG: sigma-70 family RNA polymerase sigma factor [Silicimonas sp.]
MFNEQNHYAIEVSRHDAEAKLIACRNRFLGFLRRRLSSPQDAEDVFQDFCVKVLRHHAQIRSPERLDAWLGITLRHTLTDHYRRRATRNSNAEAYAIEAKVTRQEVVDDEEPACRCIAAAMKMLEPSQAELLARIDLQDEPRKVVAADLGLTLNALGVRVHRSRAALKTRIAEICPVCGEGGFLQCDCTHSRDIEPLATARQSETATGM